MTSQIRQNYHTECEQGLNEQIKQELYASYVYQEMGYHFERDDVSLASISKYFKELSDNKREQASQLMKYQTKRGGKTILFDIKKPNSENWTSQLAFENALKLEKDVNQVSFVDFRLRFYQDFCVSLCWIYTDWQISMEIRNLWTFWKKNSWKAKCSV